MTETENCGRKEYTAMKVYTHRRTLEEARRSHENLVLCNEEQRRKCEEEIARDPQKKIFCMETCHCIELVEKTTAMTGLTLLQALEHVLAGKTIQREDGGTILEINQHSGALLEYHDGRDGLYEEAGLLRRLDISMKWNVMAAKTCGNCGKTVDDGPDHVICNQYGNSRPRDIDAKNCPYHKWRD